MTPKKEILKITNGRKADNINAAILMYMAFDDFSQYLFGVEDEESILKYFREVWKKKHNRLSYEYSYIVRKNDEPIGLLSCYGGGLINPLFIPSLWSIIKVNPGVIKYILRHPQYLRTLLANPEALPDEFYIFMLAVLPKDQNKGLGTKLLDFAEEEARIQNYKKISLLVRRDNVNAIRFYERNGFKKVKSYREEPMNFYKMVKNLKKTT